MSKIKTGHRVRIAFTEDPSLKDEIGVVRKIKNGEATIQLTPKPPDTTRTAWVPVEYLEVEVSR